MQNYYDIGLSDVREGYEPTGVSLVPLYQLRFAAGGGTELTFSIQLMGDYPSEKSGLTGIIYEPWHSRCVGREHARLIYERGVCPERIPPQKDKKAAVTHSTVRQQLY